MAAEEIRNTRQLEILVEHYDESWWREVTRLFVGLGNPSYFNELMQAVGEARRLAGHESFTDECIRDALRPSAEPFLALASMMPPWWYRLGIIRQGSRAPSAQRYYALLAMRSLPPAELARVADRIARIQRDRDEDIGRLARSLLVLSGGREGALASAVDAVTGLPTLRINPVDGSDMVVIPAGPFAAGAQGESDNQPRQLELPSFYMARYPVTNAQYARFVDATGRTPPEYFDNERFSQPQQPVVGVSWNDAVAYCKWAGLRLPTEWEWEKGARGTDGRPYPWGKEDPDELRANFGDKVGQPSPVGSYPAGASPYGLMDMAGNVWEWTASEYTKGQTRTVRGGAFYGPAQYLRAAYRIHFQPDYRLSGLGFRCAQDPVPP